MAGRPSTKKISELADKLMNKRSLGAIVRSLNLEQIDKIITTLQELRQEAEEAQALVLQQQAEQKEKLQEIYQYAKDKGFDPDQMAAFFSSMADPKSADGNKKTVIKYRLTDAAGTHTWSGRGPVPSWLKGYETDGKSRADCLVGEDGLTALERSQAAV